MTFGASRSTGAASQPSGNLLADRRFAYAKALMAEGDYGAAADLLHQVLELAPRWVPALMALGTAAERSGAREAAATAFATAAVHDRDGIFGARLHVERLQGRVGAPDLPAAYVAALFDDYAARFDQHLLDTLAYRGPAILCEALAAAGAPPPYGRALDLGCGTGLMGRAIRHAVGTLEGVDLSPAMVRHAESTGLYDKVTLGPLTAALADQPAGSLDLVLAADVFVYCGALDGIMTMVARVLAAGGILAFTAQRGADAPVRLGDDMRVSHSAAYLREVVAGAGLDLLRLVDGSTRLEAGRPVPGLVAVARKP